MLPERLDWDSLRVFRVVAELASMSAAAVRLRESAPTVSRKIDELEKDLGARLFTRSPRGVELTDSGRIVLRYVERMAEAARALREEALPSHSPIEGVITLATGDGIGPYWIANRIARFETLYPGVQVRLNVEDTPADVTSERADIALHFTEPRQSDIIAHKLGTQHYMTFASHAYLREHRMPESLFEFHKHRCLLHRSYASEVERWAPKTSEMRKMVGSAFVSNSATALIQACAAGGGIALLPSFIAEIDDRLVALDLPEVAPVPFWVVYTERLRRLPRGQVFIEWLRRLFEADEAIWFREEFIHPRDRFLKTGPLLGLGRWET